MAAPPASRLPKHTTPPVDPNIFKKFLAIAESRLTNESLLREEFLAVKERDNLIEESTHVAVRQPAKNRYSNVHPYDYNRVHLAGGTDYINASHVHIRDPLGFELRYIAAQGPTPRTVTDFWAMVVEQHVAAIVMVTNLVENRMTKCALYYPENEGDIVTAGKMQLRNVQVIRDSSALTVRKLEINGDTSCEVYHFHYQAWPDHGTPEETSPIWKISNSLDDLRGLNGQQPVLVHCSAGIGRTGTFCALDTLRHRLDALERCIAAGGHGTGTTSAGGGSPCGKSVSMGRIGRGTGGDGGGGVGPRRASLDDVVKAGQLDVGAAAVLDVPGLVHHLRRQRGGMVQSMEQYVFIYQALVDELRRRCVR